MATPEQRGHRPHPRPLSAQRCCHPQNPNLGDVTWNMKGTREQNCWLFGAAIVMCWRPLCRKSCLFSCPGAFWHIHVFDLATLQKQLHTGAGPGSTRGLRGPGSHSSETRGWAPQSWGGDRHCLSSRTKENLSNTLPHFFLSWTTAKKGSLFLFYEEKFSKVPGRAFYFF